MEGRGVWMSNNTEKETAVCASRSCDAHCSVTAIKEEELAIPPQNCPFGGGDASFFVIKGVDYKCPECEDHKIYKFINCNLTKKYWCKICLRTFKKSEVEG